VCSSDLPEAAYTLRPAAAAGCRFDFRAETVRPLVALTRSELAKLN